MDELIIAAMSPKQSPSKDFRRSSDVLGEAASASSWAVAVGYPPLSESRARRVRFTWLPVLLCLLRTYPVRSEAVRDVLLITPGHVVAGGPVLVGAVAYNTEGDGVGGAVLNFDFGDGALKQAPVKKKTGLYGFASCQVECPRGATGIAKVRCWAEPRDGLSHSEGLILIGEGWRPFLSTDKDQYQPGTTVRGRVLCLGMGTLCPDDSATVRVELVNPRGTLAAAMEGIPSRFGVVPFAFELSDGILPGRYRLRCSAGTGRKDEKTVQVRRYLMPRLLVRVEVEKRRLAPQDALKGKVQAEYRYGKVCSQAKVAVRLRDLERGKELLRLNGTTDDDGRFSFQGDLPGELSLGDRAEKGLALTVRVTDAAGDEGRAGTTLTVVREGHVEFIPEAGRLVRNETNKVYVLCSGAVGEDKAARVTLKNFGRSLGTKSVSRLGLAVFEVPVRSAALLEAQVSIAGSMVATKKRIAVGPGPGILVQPSRSIVRAGETLKIKLRAPEAAKSIALTLISQSGQILDLDCVDGGGLSVPELIVPETAFGVLSIRAEAGPSLKPITGRARICVLGGREWPLALRSDRAAYRPREEAGIALSSSLPLPSEGIAEICVTDESLRGLSSVTRPPLLSSILLNGLGTSREVAGRTLAEVIAGRVPGAEGELDTLASALLAPPLVEQAAQEVNPSTAVPAPIPATDKTDYTKLIRGYAAKRGRDDIVEKVLFKIGLCLILSERYMQAGDFFREFAERVRHPSLRPAALYWAGDSYLKAGDARRSYQMFKRGIWDYPEAKWAKFARGRLTAPVFDRIVGAGAAIPPGPKAPRRSEPRRTGPLKTREAGSTFPSAIVARAPDTVLDDVRSFFPETLFYHPAFPLGKDGRADLRLRLPDSITQWRVKVLASTLDGHLGTATTRLKVGKPFFVSLRMPYHMVVGDEIDGIAIACNETGQDRKVVLKGEASPELKLLATEPARLEVRDGERGHVRVRLKAVRSGPARFSIAAEAGEHHDAVQHTVRIDPDGYPKIISSGGVLSGSASHVVKIPKATGQRDARLTLRLYPTPVADVTQGMASLVRMPHGCFEQTVSANYPNVLVLDLLKSLERIDKPMKEKAVRFAGLGYQRLLSFEVPGGGFEWYGRKPARLVLTAYGLMHLSDLAGIIQVDQALIRRTREWIMSRRGADEVWRSDGGDGDLRRAQVTAYVCGALIHAGMDARELRRGIAFADKVRKKSRDVYLTAMLTDVVLRGGRDPKLAKRLAKELAKMATIKQGTASWLPETSTVMGSRGSSAIVETTSLAVMALGRAGGHLSLVRQGLAYLSYQRNRGRWGNTQATIMALRALCECHQLLSAKSSPRVAFTMDGNAMPMPDLDFSDSAAQVFEYPIARPGTHRFRLESDEAGMVRYSLDCSFSAPWDDYEPRPGATLFASAFPREGGNQFRAGERTTFTTQIENKDREAVQMPLVRVRLPAGFQADETDFDCFVRTGSIARAAVSADEIILYLDSLAAEEVREISYSLTPSFACKGQFPSTEIYEYYTPENRYLATPWEIEVSRGGLAADERR